MDLEAQESTPLIPRPASPLTSREEQRLHRHREPHHDDRISRCEGQEPILCRRQRLIEGLALLLGGSLGFCLVVVLFLCIAFYAVLVFVVGLLLVAFVFLAFCVWVPWFAFNLPHSWAWVNQERLSVQHYRVKPLEAGEAAIRVLRLLPGRPEEQLSGELHSLHWHAIQYEALSYVWGEDVWEVPWSLQHFIMLEGSHFWIQPSLERALRALRSPYGSRWIWIDALCIDQENSDEKAAQISKMAQIFGHASSVTVFLDIMSNDDSTWVSIGTLFASVVGCASLEHSDLVALIHRLTAEEITALATIVRQPWWKRVWVIQEVSAGSRVIVQCGRHVLDWEDLAVVIVEVKRSQTLGVPQNVILFVQQVQRLRKDDEDVSFGLLSHLCQFRQSQASISRDRVFGLMNLIKAPEHRLDIVVTYRGPTADVYADLCRQAISKYRSLNVFIGLELLTDHGGDASWLHRWDWHYSKQPRRSLWNGGLKVPSVTSSDLFSASGGGEAMCPGKSPDLQVLRVQGWECDSIAVISAPYRSDASLGQKMKVVQRWWDLLCKKEPLLDHETLTRRLMHTMTAGTLAVEQSGDGLAVFARPENLAKLDLVAHGRRLFITRSGAIGLGHADCRGDDLVCILMGAAVPYVLRHARHDGPGYQHSTPMDCFLRCDKARHRNCCMPALHRLVGQAYVSTLMRYTGDILEDMASGRLRVKEYFLE